MTIYNWEEYRSISENERIEFHLGGHKQIHTLDGKDELLRFNKEGKKVYKFYKYSDGFSYEYTYDSNGNILTYKNSNDITRGFDIPE